MSGSKAVRVAGTGARLIGGLALSAACVAGVVVAVPMTLPGVQSTPAQTSVTPYPGDTLLTCAGPFRAVGRDATNATQQSTAGVPVIVSGADGTALQEETIATPDLADNPETTWFLGVPENREPAQIAAAESVDIRSDDLAGFAAASCREPSMESWIVGGAATTGASDILLVANPSEVTATVTFTVYGAQGTSKSQTVIPARTQRSIPLAEGAAGESSPVVQVTVSGAPVRAALQSSLIRTLDPAGIDLQDGVVRPDTSLQLLGVRAVLASTADAASTKLRLLAPTADADVTIRARAAADGAAAGDPIDVSIEAGLPSEVDLSMLQPGLYSIEIEASAPVVAAAWQTTAIGKGADFAWMTSAPELRGTTTFAVADGPQPQVQLTNAGDAAIEAVLTPLGAGEQRIEVPAHGSAMIDVAAGTVYTLESEGALRAAVSYLGTGQIAGYPVHPTSKASQPIVVTQ
ncbi:hypothetical protein GCM10025768_10680 [Microbacterium pseudoresistens]|uniref:Large extracellular alpha-helical protein n=1 Tax=Microbacterium pseudoresistens TaxID=640634 RepID=A0A7Y9EW90_9MICO|nr:DUF5719 family protein [Microbacterium pseudoresistens]NYD54971.1 hypothetical protein [Microbacterium pseudoresistens]